MSTSNAGCAISHDDKLLDASQITWYNDADNDISISAPAPDGLAQATWPQCEAISTARLIDGNSEKLLLKSQKAAIEADRLQKAAAAAPPPPGTKRKKSTTKTNDDDLVSGGELTSVPKAKQAKLSGNTGMSCMHIGHS